MKGESEQAEKSYLCVDGGAQAVVEMYKKHKQYGNLLRFVKTHQTMDIGKTYSYIGQELEKQNKLRDAEKYYLCCEDWKAVINMYK